MCCTTYRSISMRGRTVAVVGESGSGKSTVARCITGLLPPRGGEVRFNGEALPAHYRARSKDQLRQVQMIYQMADTALNPKLRIRDIVGRPVQFYGGLRGAELRRRTEELLEQIELEPDLYIDRLPSELSGGQKQRIGIARALAAESQFIICDEVTSALDQLVAEGILKLLDRLQNELNLAYMFITHDLATVRAIADEVVVMKDGRVVEAGPKTEMFTPPAPRLHRPAAEFGAGDGSGLARPAAGAARRGKYRGGGARQARLDCPEQVRTTNETIVRRHPHESQTGQTDATQGERRHGAGGRRGAGDGLCRRAESRRHLAARPFGRQQHRQLGRAHPFRRVHAGRSPGRRVRLHHRGRCRWLAGRRAGRELGALGRPCDLDLQLAQGCRIPQRQELRRRRCDRNRCNYMWRKARSRRPSRSSSPSSR